MTCLSTELLSSSQWLHNNRTRITDQHRWYCYQTKKGSRLLYLIPYSWKIWRGIKLGSLAVYITTAKLKSAKMSYLHIIIRMAIPYRTAKFKFANILATAILGSITKFNSRQYFRLYGNNIISHIQYYTQVML